MGGSWISRCLRIMLWWWQTERKLCQLVTEFGRVFERRKLRVNMGKSMVMRCTRNEDGARLNVLLNGEALEEVDQFKYLGSVITTNGGVEADVHHRVNEGCKVLGALKGVMKNRSLGMNVNPFAAIRRHWRPTLFLLDSAIKIGLG